MCFLDIKVIKIGKKYKVVIVATKNMWKSPEDGVGSFLPMLVSISRIGISGTL